MSNPFLAQMIIFAGNFAPKGWAFCDGQLLPISQNTALFSLLGTDFGGDGRSNFALPNLQGSAPMHAGGGGSSGGLTSRSIGESGGVTEVTLDAAEMPGHGHTVGGVAATGTTTDPVRGVWAQAQVGRRPLPTYTAPGGSTQDMAPQAISTVGSSGPHPNLQPYLTMNFVIALQGVYPSRS